jgi:hypothetical protein
MASLQKYNQKKTLYADDDIKILIDNNKIRKYGQSLYKHNKTMQDIANVMEHPEFNKFFNKYFKNPEEAIDMLLLLKIYNSISREDPYEKIAILFESISNTKIRDMLINKFIEWKNTSKLCNALSKC